MKRMVRRGVACAMVAMLLWVAAAWAADPQGSGAPPDAKSALRRLGLEKGVCVLLGLPEPGRPESVADVAAGSELIVYFQSPAAEEEMAVRRAAEAAGLLGRRVFADRGSWRSIHLADNLAGCIWIAEAARDQVPRGEILRVLHPEGVAFLGSEEVVKPLPEGIDAWSHPYHGPDNNPQSEDRLSRMPYATQFLAEPLFSPMPEVTVAAGGRVFKAFGHIAHKANQNPVLNTLMGINGFNGAVLWKRPLREGFMIHRNTIIATPDILYLADDESLKLIDARTGQVRDEVVVPEGIADGKVWKWMALETEPDGRPVLYALVGGEEVRPRTVPSQTRGLGHWPWAMWEGHEYGDPRTNFGFGRTFVALDPRAKRILWTHREEEHVDARGVCMRGAHIYFYIPEKALGCLDARTGTPLWKSAEPELLRAIGRTGRAQNPTEGYATSSFIKCDDQRIFFAGPQRPNLVVASAKDGKLLWQKKGGNLHLVLRPGGFYAVGPGGGKMTYERGDLLAPLPNRRSCTRATGSIDSIFYRAAEGTMHISTADNRAQHIAPMRPPCQDGVIMAAGMLYWGPWMCGCPLSFYGHVALTPAGDPDGRQGLDGPPLELGEGDPERAEKLEIAPGDWPCYRHDNRRTSATVVPLPERARREWTFEPPAGGRPTAPVAAGGLVFVGYESGAVRALDTATGKPRWQAHAAGAVFLSPAVWEGRIYVGSADGRVSAFEAATGRRLWTFCAAPRHRWIPVFGKLISTWPVAGGVVVEDGVVYAAAGIGHYDGTHVYALDAVTGKLKWHNDSSGTLSPEVRSGISLQGELFLHGGELCFAGGSVYQTASYDLKTGACSNDPLHRVGSQYATAFYPYYPEYGQYQPLRHELPDGRTLSYDVAYEGSEHSTLALIEGRKSGEPNEPRIPVPQRVRRASRRAIWEYPAGPRFNGFVMGPNALLAAGRQGSPGGEEFFVAAVSLKDGSNVWREKLPAAAVKAGAAVDRSGRILLSLDDGRVVCFAAAR